MYYMDDEFSSRTDTDNGETDNEASVLYGNLSENDAKLGNELYCMRHTWLQREDGVGSPTSLQEDTPLQ